MPPDHPLSPGGSTLAIMDANVLLPPRLSDLLFDCALAGLYCPRWTQDIEAEFIEHFGEVVLTKGKQARREVVAAGPNPAHIAKARHRLGCFRAAIGAEHEVLLYDRPEYRSKVPNAVDKGDIHVASAALVLRSLSDGEGLPDKVFIISNNLTHLGTKDMAALGIAVVSPGAFIEELNAVAPDRVEQALLKTVNDLMTPPFTKANLLGLLDAHGAKAAAKHWSQKWQVKIYQQGLAP